MTDLTTQIVIFAAMIAGALATWLTMKSRAKGNIEAAVNNATTKYQVEVAQVNERIRAVTGELEASREEFAELTKRSEGYRLALDTSKDEQARLTERSSRVPQLESDVHRLTEELRTRMEDIAKLSSSEAQKSQLIESGKEQIKALQGSLETVQQQYQTANLALREQVERRAALEEQAGRVPELELQLRESSRQLAEVNEHLTTLRESSARENGRLAAELTAKKAASELLEAELVQLRANHAKAEAQVNELTDQLTELRTRAAADQRNSVEKLELLLQAKEALSDQFKALATDILEEKSKRFTEQNQQGLSQLLDPLKQKLVEFQGKVEEVYVNEGKDRSALSAQVNRLVELNNALSEDAKNLTLALKGSAKTQGNWGELILERVLEASGLRKGHEYHVQDSQVREDGTRGQADVIIDLPEDRKIVVDAKVSLVAYERYVSAESDTERAVALKQHLDSVRGHIKGLSDKRYHTMYGIKSLDFVLAFIPIEPAFMVAVTNDDELFMDAWNKNVLLVSPSTLLFVVRTVAHLWRQEAQSRNAQEIAKRGGDLYDKLCGFVDDLETVGSRIGQAQKAYDAAHGKLSTGRGNVIRQAEMLRDLGVKPSKELPAPTVEKALDPDDNVVALPSPSATA